MFVIVVFSFNRPMQLEALLHSIFRSIDSTSVRFEVKILYGFSNSEFKQGYETLKQKSIAKEVEFLQEERGIYKFGPKLFLRSRNTYRYFKYPFLRNLTQRSNLKPLLESILNKPESKYVMFLTDDSLFYRDFTLGQEVFDLIDENPQQAFFSLRHGKNIHSAPSRGRNVGDFYHWQIDDAECDAFWSYPFSVDGHIYSLQFLLSQVEPLLYINPNTFEGSVAHHAAVKHLFSNGYCFEQSVLASFPINKVQNVVENEDLGIDSELLNKKYLEGYTLEYSWDKQPTTFQLIPENLRIIKNGFTEEMFCRDSASKEITVR